ncbi:MAG: long-chain fatty acid--CoA ligase [Kiloniellales bacterium]|nr:long-chain fatty acid--CoA ligase [Kiloniellales bacterium]
MSSYPGDVDWAAAIPDEPLPEVLERSVAQFGDRPCVDFLGKGYSYREIGVLVDRAARGFQALGVGPGSNVGLLLPNTPYFVICFYAVLKAGGTVVNFNPLYVAEEIERQVLDSQTSILVTLDVISLLPKAAAVLDSKALEKIVVCSMADILPFPKNYLYPFVRRSDIARVPRDGRYLRFDDLTDNDGAVAPVAIRSREHVAVLQYTGGTTGIPKGAMLTHANIAINARQVAAWFPGLAAGGERIYGVLPLFHVFAMTSVMNLGVLGAAEMVLAPRFDLDQALRVIDRKKITLFPGVPTVYNAINQHPDLDNHDLSSLKYCFSGGAPLPVEVKRAFERLTGCRLVEGYGLSETSPVATCNPLDAPKEGSIGLPLPQTTIEVRDPERPERLLAQGEKGEICVRGPQVMAGYWRNREATEAVMIDGALRTGDVGYLDRDGYAYLIDRIKDLILCSGFNVYPRVVEEAIYRHEAVAEVIVCGVPDDYRGEAPKAFIRLKDGARLTAEELLDFLADKLSKIELPEHIEFRAELPKTQVGKLSKKALIEEERAKRAAAARP